MRISIMIKAYQLREDATKAIKRLIDPSTITRIEYRAATCSYALRGSFGRATVIYMRRDENIDKIEEVCSGMIAQYLIHDEVEVYTPYEPLELSVVRAI